jgi:hypothetical protein
MLFLVTSNAQFCFKKPAYSGEPTFRFFSGELLRRYRTISPLVSMYSVRPIWFVPEWVPFLMTLRTVKSVGINTGTDSLLFRIEYSENSSYLKRVYLGKKEEKVFRNLGLILLVNVDFFTASVRIPVLIYA